MWQTLSWSQAPGGLLEWVWYKGKRSRSPDRTASSSSAGSGRAGRTPDWVPWTPSSPASSKPTTVRRQVRASRAISVGKPVAPVNTPPKMPSLDSNFIRSPHLTHPRRTAPAMALSREALRPFRTVPSAPGRKRMGRAPVSAMCPTRGVLPGRGATGRAVVEGAGALHNSQFLVFRSCWVGWPACAYPRERRGRIRSQSRPRWGVLAPVRQLTHFGDCLGG